MEIKTFTQLSRQNTGRHFLDSGDAYGRNYDRALTKGVSIDADYSEHCKEWYVSASIPLGKFLDAAFEVNFELQSILEAQDFHRLNSREAAEEFRDYLLSEYAEQIEVEIGDWYNSYNQENDLDQNFQYHTITIDGEEYWIIETHNGCDIRGGYSSCLIAKPVSEYHYELSARWCISEAFKNGKKSEELLKEFQNNDCQDDLNYILGKRKILNVKNTKSKDTKRLVLEDGIEIVIYALSPAISNWG